MNPFDVIKTRLQTQHSSDPLFHPTASPHVTSPLSLRPGTATATAPAALGSNNAVARLIRHEGMGVLWRGVGPAMIIAMPSQASYMVGYDLIRRALLDRPLPFFIEPASGNVSEIHKLGAPLVAGGTVRAAIVSFFSPIELLRTRLQSLPPSDSFNQVLKSTLDVVRTDGVASLWRGLPASLWRDVPFSAIYWASYEVMQRMLTGSGFGETIPQRGDQTWAVAFTSGAVSGSVRPSHSHLCCKPQLIGECGHKGGCYLHQPLRCDQNAQTSFCCRCTTRYITPHHGPSKKARHPGSFQRPDAPLS